MKKIFYIGIDDTDILEGPGTGKIARGVASRLEELGLGRHRGVIRHQLLVDPRIPYTSHNSAKCVLFETSYSAESLSQPCIDYLAEHFQPGSDPGLCICEPEQFNQELEDYGTSAQKEYLSKQQAYRLAQKLGVFLVELGGTGDGVIGALAAVSLSAGGNDGRYVHLRGIKEVNGLITAGLVKEKTDTVCIIDDEGQVVPDSALIDSLGWIRPSRIKGEPRLRVRLEKDGEGKEIWRPIERKLRAHSGK
ncbi:MAG: hypothetical protein PHS35_03040 [Dehalococcoidales bacterium]|nr:hypothetical protein [Dehalococcoidales bacterium]